MTHNPAEALRECPFCGGTAKLSSAECGLDGFPSSYRQPCCTNCDVRMGYMRAGEAIAAWNRRAALASPAPAGGEADEDILTATIIEKAAKAAYLQFTREHDCAEWVWPDSREEWTDHTRAALAAVLPDILKMVRKGTSVTPPPSPDVAGVVERLRDWQDYRPMSEFCPAAIPDLLEAATLLEALSRERDEMKKRLEVDEVLVLGEVGGLKRVKRDGIDERDEIIRFLEADKAALSAEVEKLREALERISEATPQSTNTVSAEGAFSYARAVACTALTSKES